MNCFRTLAKDQRLREGESKVIAAEPLTVVQFETIIQHPVQL